MADLSIELFPETRLFHIVGTNVAFVRQEQADEFIAENRAKKGEQFAVLRTPLYLLSKGVQVVYGPIPEHRAAVYQKADEVGSKLVTLD